jgi:hypothetical protein
VLGAESVIVPCGLAGSSTGAITFYSAVDEPRQVSGFVGRVIDQEFEPRCMSQAQAASNLTTQESTRARKSLTHLSKQTV